MADVKSTFESIIFEWDECKSNIENVHEFVEVFLKITDPYNKISTRILEHTLRVMKLADRIMNKETADREIVLISILIGTIESAMARFRMTHVFEFIFIMTILSLLILALVTYKLYGN